MVALAGTDSAPKVQGIPHLKGWSRRRNCHQLPPQQGPKASCDLPGSQGASGPGCTGTVQWYRDEVWPCESCFKAPQAGPALFVVWGHPGTKAQLLFHQMEGRENAMQLITKESHTSSSSDYE